MSSAARIALKVTRRKSPRAATWEIYVHKLVGEADSDRAFVRLHEFFLHEGHVCLAFERFGRSLEEALSREPLSLPRAKDVTRRILQGLANLHARGFVHSDVKPENILYDARRGEARLADLGSATNRIKQCMSCGTREYLAPELLLGAPVGVELDQWSVGCTVFEMLTGRLLFSPRRAAARKYRGFHEDTPAIPIAASVAEDRAAERAEQYRKGDVLAGKYLLKRKLGQGRFGTVWAAEARHWRSAGCEYAEIWAHAAEIVESRPERTEDQKRDSLWRNERGADDLIDLAINHEHTILMQSLLGAFPSALVKNARYRAAYFEADGALRFRPAVKAVPIRTRLFRGTRLRGRELDCAADFLAGLLAMDRTARVSAADALKHDWLREVG